MEKYLEHFSGDEAFCRMIMSLKEQVIDKNMWHLTPFYDPHEISVIQRLLGNQEDLKMYHYGGIECAEMQRVIMAPSFYTIEPSDFEITVFQARFPSKFVKLTHRDVLGALMSLGLKRESYGDILVKDDICYFAVDAKMKEYIQENLSKISRGSIQLSICKHSVTNEPNFRCVTRPIASFRLDVIIAELFHLSRAEAKRLIEASLVKVNYKEVEQCHFLCHNNDIISVRRHGRVLLRDLNKQNRKGKYLIEGCYYQ